LGYIALPTYISVVIPIYAKDLAHLRGSSLAGSRVNVLPVGVVLYAISTTVKDLEEWTMKEYD
jgi:hypothetical protein